MYTRSNKFFYSTTDIIASVTKPQDCSEQEKENTEDNKNVETSRKLQTFLEAQEENIFIRFSLHQGIYVYIMKQ